MSCEKDCKLGKTYCCMECPSYDICREKRKNRKSSFEKAVKWIAVSIAVPPEVDMNYMANLKQKPRVERLRQTGRITTGRFYRYDENQMSLF